MLVPYSDHGYGPPIDGELGLVRTTDELRIIDLSEGRNAWHHIVSYWWMQMSGRSLWIPISDFEARAVRLDTVPSHLRPALPDDVKMWDTYHETGWPLKAMTCSIHWETQVSNADIIYRVERGIQLPRDREFHPRAVPLMPLWPGFPVNVLMWGGLWWGAMHGWRAWRRHRRTRTNRCAECGYSLTGLPFGHGCPECGAGRSPAPT